jgi:hypothetical protein
MNKIDHEELFGSVKNFLKSKGIDLQEGTYSQRIRQGCGLLADSINLSHKAWTSAKNTVDEQLGKLRQTIHEQTAPKPPRSQAAPPPQSGSTKSGTAPKSSKKTTRSSAKRRSSKSKS